MAEQTTDPAPIEPQFWRRTPPALFPALLGLLGLGLAWRAASGALPDLIPSGIGEAILGVGGLVYLFCLSAYISKVSFRPMVLLEDMMSPPGRAGAATLTMSLFLFAVALLPYAPTISAVLFWVALIAHLGMAVAAVLVMSQQELGLKVTPAWHLSFVGFIVAPLCGVPLGYTGISAAIFAITALFAALIYAVSLLQMSRDTTPPPARPLLAIHLSPVSLFATASALLGFELLAYGFVVVAVGLGAVLLSRYSELTEAGFSPLWGAFTFPVTALASALFLTSQFAGGLAWLGLVPLLTGTLIIPVIATRIGMLWINGELAKRTGASMA